VVDYDDIRDIREVLEPAGDTEKYFVTFDKNSDYKITFEELY